MIDLSLSDVGTILACSHQNTLEQEGSECWPFLRTSGQWRPGRRGSLLEATEVKGVVLQQNLWCVLTLETNTQRAGNPRPRPGPPLCPGCWPGVWARGQGMTWVSSTLLPPDLRAPRPGPFPTRPSGWAPLQRAPAFKCQIREVPLPLPCGCFTPSHALAFPFLRNYNNTLKNKRPSPVTGVKEKAGPWRERGALKWRE